jgi:hypothetical protein
MKNYLRNGTGKDQFPILLLISIRMNIVVDPEEFIIFYQMKNKEV